MLKVTIKAFLLGKRDLSTPKIKLWKTPSAKLRAWLQQGLPLR
jgi:hypothetical protein